VGRALILKSNQSKPFSTAIILTVALCILGLLTQISPAGLSLFETTSRVEIDGVLYGAFDTIEGLPSQDPKSVSWRKQADGGFRIRFLRDFVTEPSLYLWAKNITANRSEPKDIYVTYINKDGDEVVRYNLKQCQPLSWTVEAANPALGGFHEIVEVAVQDIETY
jgi:hypothetical protein